MVLNTTLLNEIFLKLKKRLPEKNLFIDKGLQDTSSNHIVSDYLGRFYVNGKSFNSSINRDKNVFVSFIFNWNKEYDNVYVVFVNLVKSSRTFIPYKIEIISKCNGIEEYIIKRCKAAEDILPDYNDPQNSVFNNKDDLLDYLSGMIVEWFQ